MCGCSPPTINAPPPARWDNVGHKRGTIRLKISGVLRKKGAKEHIVWVDPLPPREGALRREDVYRIQMQAVGNLRSRLGDGHSSYIKAKLAFHVQGMSPMRVFPKSSFKFTEDSLVDFMHNMKGQGGRLIDEDYGHSNKKKNHNMNHAGNKDKLEAAKLCMYSSTPPIGYDYPLHILQSTSGLKVAEEFVFLRMYALPMARAGGLTDAKQIKRIEMWRDYCQLIAGLSCPDGILREWITSGHLQLLIQRVIVQVEVCQDNQCIMPANNLLMYCFH